MKAPPLFGSRNWSTNFPASTRSFGIHAIFIVLLQNCNKADLASSLHSKCCLIPEFVGLDSRHQTRITQIWEDSEEITMKKTALALGLIALAGVATAQQGAVPKDIPHLDHVFFIMMENHGYGRSWQPERAVHNSCAMSANLATNYFAVGHPSLTNYLESVGGSNFGIRSDNRPTFTMPAASPILRRIGQYGQSAEPEYLPDCRQRDRTQRLRFWTARMNDRTELRDRRRRKKGYPA